MSEARSALPGASFSGIIKVAEAGLRGMITLRGDLSDKGLTAAVTSVAGVDLPAPRGIAMAGDTGAAWMSPDELLIMVPYAQARAAVDDLRAQLAGQHALVENVSDARAVFRLTGPEGHLREVVAKLAPVDMDPAAFGMGEMRRTKFSQVAAAFWMDEGGITVVCFRSVARYMFDLLSIAAQPGSEVGLYA